MSEVRSDPGKRAAIIRKCLLFLEENYEFKPFKQTENIVRLENRRIYVAVHHGNLGEGVNLSFGPLKAPGQSQNTFEAGELVALTAPDTEMPFRDYPVHTWEDLEAVMNGWANFLLTVGVPVLRCDREMFDQLALHRQEKAREEASREAVKLLDKTQAKVVVRDGLAAISETEVRRSTIPSVEIDPVAHLEEAERITSEMLQVSMDPDRFEEWQAQVNAMEPHPMDYGECFNHEGAEVAQRVYQSQWSRGLVAPTPQPGHTTIRVAACFSEWLRSDNRTSKRFPPEYKELARFLQPNMIWLLWKYMGSGKVKPATYDGLVWLGKYWAWFPSPHVYLAELYQDKESQGDRE